MGWLKYLGYLAAELSWTIHIQLKYTHVTYDGLTKVSKGFSSWTIHIQLKYTHVTYDGLTKVSGVFSSWTIHIQLKYTHVTYDGLTKVLGGFSSWTQHTVCQADESIGLTFRHFEPLKQNLGLAMTLFYTLNFRFKGFFNLKKGLIIEFP